MALKNDMFRCMVHLQNENKGSSAVWLSDPSDTEDLFPLINGSRAVPGRKTRQIRRNRFVSSRKKDLMTKNKRRNTRRLLIAGLIAAIILALVITAGILLSSSRDSSNAAPLTAAGITLEEWLGGSVSTKSFNGTWLNGDELLYQDESGNLLIFNVTSRESRVILDISNPTLSASFDHQFSADRKYILLAFNYQRLFRHTYLAQYKIVNLETMEETPLTGNDTSGLQLALWGPRGNSLVYVIQSNIYYRPRAEVAEDYQITANGAFGAVYNGVPDWVYEEEVFSSNKAIWFSPSGTKLAFGFFDDTHTPIMTIPFYGFPGSVSFQYTAAIPIHYPKSGTQNPIVKLFYVDLEKVVSGNASLIEIECPPELASMERILSAVSFPTDNILYATWMNRVQNQAYFHLCDVEKQNCWTALPYSERDGWVEQFVPPLFSKDGSSFMLILPQKQRDGGDWRHVVLVTNTTSNNTRITALTSGTFVVTEIVAWDEDNSYAYYLATTENDPAQKHLYRVSIHDRITKCLSCGVKGVSDGVACLYNSAEFSKDSSHYVLTCAGPGVPEVSIFNSKTFKKLYTWEDNNSTAMLLAEKTQPIVKRLTVPVPGGFEAQVKLLIPPNADLSGATKYPMLLYVYGGPDTYEVTEKFNIDWGTYLVTNKSIIYASIDGRGTGLKGNSMMFSVYRNLGTVEIADHINVTRHLQENFAFIDRSRTALWGWSYGGYATGMALAMDFEGIFKCGMSVAPVTDWMLYDSVYTERFMGLPNAADNFGGYEQAQLLNKVDNIRNKEYYLIHGTLDDNVHYQQTMMLAKVLEQKDILFRQQTYTDENHDIARSRLHLYHSMQNFLDGCFKKAS